MASDARLIIEGAQHANDEAAAWCARYKIVATHRSRLDIDFTLGERALADHWATRSAVPALNKQTGIDPTPGESHLKASISCHSEKFHERGGGKREREIGLRFENRGHAHTQAQ